MHKTHAEAKALASELLSLLPPEPAREVVLCPPFTSLQAVAEELAGTPVALGAQNLHWEREGAYTGEVSGEMLAALGCRYVIVGHSERRTHFGESDEAVARKLMAARRCGMVPILCVGETLEEREAGRTEEVVVGQLSRSLEGWPGESPLVVAYEPVWAIGTGMTATRAQAEQVHRVIREWLAMTLGRRFAASTRVLYGGSVKPENAAELLGSEHIDGALVGGASLVASAFVEICCA